VVVVDVDVDVVVLGDVVVCVDKDVDDNDDVLDVDSHKVVNALSKNEKVWHLFWLCVAICIPSLPLSRERWHAVFSSEYA